MDHDLISTMEMLECARNALTRDLAARKEDYDKQAALFHRVRADILELEDRLYKVNRAIMAIEYRNSR